MPDCFISYATEDRELAQFVYDELKRHGVSVFMASASLRPGEQWSSTILANLKNSAWVILLASRAACASAYVNQEVGGALLGSKALVPIVWDIDPSALPGWASRFQAIDLRGATLDDLRHQVGGIAARIQQKNWDGLLIIGAVALGILLVAGKKN